MCVTKFGATELLNENSNFNIEGLVCKHVQRNVSYHSDDSFDKIIVHWADITLLYMCIVNGK